MSTQRVLLFGATGLVGQEVLKRLNSASEVQEIRVLARRGLSKTLLSAKVHEYITDFDKLDTKLGCFDVDAVICAIGTTIGKAGSQGAFRKVDYDYPLEIAKLAKKSGAKAFLLVSALGADPNSMFFYNKVKGELERDLEKIGFQSLVIVRPSVLIGRRMETRLAEGIGQKLMSALPRTWRAVPAENVARAIVDSIQRKESGTKVIKNSELF